MAARERRLHSAMSAVESRLSGRHLSGSVISLVRFIENDWHWLNASAIEALNCAFEMISSQYEPGSEATKKDLMTDNETIQSILSRHRVRFSAER